MYQQFWPETFFSCLNNVGGPVAAPLGISSCRHGRKIVEHEHVESAVIINDGTFYSLGHCTNGGSARYLKVSCIRISGNMCYFSSNGDTLHFWGYFYPLNFRSFLEFFQQVGVNDFQGDPTDTLSETSSLVMAYVLKHLLVAQAILRLKEHELELESIVKSREIAYLDLLGIPHGVPAASATPPAKTPLDKPSAAPQQSGGTQQAESSSEPKQHRVPSAVDSVLKASVSVRRFFGMRPTGKDDSSSQELPSQADHPKPVPGGH